MLEKLRRLRADHFKIQHDLSFYPYQETVSDRMIAALLDNLRITAGATEEDVKRLKQIELAIEQSRQSGKSYGVAYTCEFILTFLPTMFKRPIRIGIFAAQLDQAKISYTILRNGLRQAKALMLITPEQEKYIAEEENARRLVLPDGSSATIAPINKISLIEGASLDLIIIDEAQFADDEIVKHSIWPMGASTNAPRIYIGKAGNKINYFYRLSQKNNSLKIYFDDVVKQRRELYEQTHDARHLIYEQTVREEIARDGEDADHIQQEYFGVWKIGTGQFTTEQELEALVEKRNLTFQYKKTECFVGIDTAKAVDSTVVTVTRLNPDTGKRDLLNWMELKGDNYQDQFDIITGFNSQTGEMTGQGFLDNYKVIALAIDSTGQGDFMPDLFERHTEWRDEHSGLYRVPFNSSSKDKIYKNFMASIKNQTITLPSLATKLGERFKQQMLDLQKEYKGQFLSCHHPTSTSMGITTEELHDDYADSFCLAEWAYAQYYANSEPQIVVVTATKERKVEKNEGGYVENYWPGLDL